MRMIPLMAFWIVVLSPLKAADIITIDVEIRVVSPFDMIWVDCSGGGMGYVISWTSGGQGGGTNGGNQGGGSQPDCQGNPPAADLVEISSFIMHGLGSDFINSPEMGMWGNPFTVEFSVPKQDGPWHLMQNNSKVVWTANETGGGSYSQTLSGLSIIHQDVSTIVYQCSFNTPLGLGSGTIIISPDVRYRCGASFEQNRSASVICAMVNEFDKGLGLANTSGPNPGAIVVDSTSIDFVKCDNISTNITFSSTHRVTSTVSANISGKFNEFLPQVNFTIGWSEATQYTAGSSTTYHGITMKGYLEVKKISQTAQLVEFYYTWNGTPGEITGHGQAVSRSMSYEYVYGSSYCN